MKEKVMALLLCSVVSTGAQAETLYEVYTEALHNDPTYLQAVSQNKVDNEDVPQAIAALLPTVGIVGTAGVSKTRESGVSLQETGSTRTYTAALQLNQVLFNAATFDALQQARKTVRAAEATLGAALQDLMIRTSSAYFAVLEAQEELRYATARKRSLEKSLDQAQQQYNVGVSTITDVYLAKSNYSAAVASVLAAENKIAINKENLRAITGKMYATLTPLKDAHFPLVAPEPLDPQKWVDSAIERNWALQAATLTTQAAHDNISVNRAGHYPTLNANASYADAYADNSIDGTSRSYTPAAGLSLNIPLFAGGQIVSKTRAAIASYEVADASEEFTRRNVVSSTRSNYLSVLSAILQIKADQAAIEASKSALEGMEAGYRLGTQTMVDVLSAQQTLFNTQTTYASDRYNYLLTTLALKQAAGTLQANDLLNVNAWLEMDTSGV